MIHAIIDNIKNKMLSLKFIERYGGIVVPITEYQENEDGRSEKIVFPASCDPEGKACYVDRDYHELAPNDRYRSVAYWELQGDAVPFLPRRGNRIAYVGFRQQVRLVVWLNMQELGESETCNVLADHLSVLTMNALQGKHDVQGIDYIHQARLKLVRKVRKSMDIFGDYSYSNKSELMLYPFDFFALDFDVEWHMRRDCVPEELDYTRIPCLPLGDWSGGGDSGGYTFIQNVIEGDNIDIDYTDTHNPVISALVPKNTSDLNNDSGFVDENIYTKDGAIVDSLRTIDLGISNSLFIKKIIGTFSIGPVPSFPLLEIGDNSFQVVVGSTTPRIGYVNDELILFIGASSVSDFQYKYLNLKDSLGKIKYDYLKVKEYASDTDADNDADLPSGAMYAVTGNRTVKRKP